MFTFRFLQTVMLGFFLANSLAFAGAPSLMTFQSKIILPSGAALEAASVHFRFTILDTAGTCILYVEDFNTINMTGTQGVVAFPLGSGTKTYPPTATSLYEIFNNSAPSFSCQAGGTVSPSGTDNRQVVMQFNDGSGWQTLPQMAINAVPFANYATRAESLGAYLSTDYLRPATLPTCAAGHTLRWDGAAFTCIAAVVGPTYTDVTSIANASGDVTLAPATGTGAVQISSGTASASPTTGALIVSGGIGVSGGVYTGGAINSGSTVSAVTSMFTPQLYGTSTPSGSILIDGTSNATKGDVLLASAGGKVGIGTTTPASKLTVAGMIESTSSGFKFPDGSSQSSNGELIVVEQDADGASSVACTAGAWQTRTLNVVVNNTITGASLASNQVTLPAGTYVVEGSAIAFNTNIHQAVFYNTTASTFDVLGTLARAVGASGMGTDTLLVGKFTLAAPAVYELRHRCETTGSFTRASPSWGVASLSVIVKIRKIQ